MSNKNNSVLSDLISDLIQEKSQVKMYIFGFNYICQVLMSVSAIFQVFYGVLLQYFAILANKKPLNMELLNFLVKPLIEMSMETPYFAAICARERILRARTEFSETVKNPGNPN